MLYSVKDRSALTVAVISIAEREGLVTVVGDGVNLRLTDRADGWAQDSGIDLGRLDPDSDWDATSVFLAFYSASIGMPLAPEGFLEKALTIAEKRIELEGA